MRKKSLPIIIIVMIMTMLVLSCQSGTENASADVMSGSKIENVSNNSNELKGDSHQIKLLNNRLNTMIVTPTVQVGEREVVSLQVSDLDITNRWDIKLTDSEMDLLAKIVWLEARSESNQGECGVVEVVFNRMKHWDFKDDLYGVLSRKGAFSSWKLLSTAKPTKREFKNIQKVLDGETDITTPDTVYFSTSARNNKIDVVIGNHIFCQYELKKE